MPVTGVQRGNAQRLSGNPLVHCPVWGRREFLPHGVTAYPLEFALEEQTISLPWLAFFFFKSIKKMPFSFPLYLSCEFLRRSRRASTSQLPCLLLWTRPLCSIREAQVFADGILGAAFPRPTQIKQEPATHLVPNFSRERLIRLHGRYFCTKEFWLSDARSYGTVSLQKQEKLEAPVDL